MELNQNPFSKTDQIIAAVADQRDVLINEIKGYSRLKAYVVPRFEAIWLVREILKRSTPEIGRSFKRDHTSIMHALRRQEERMAASADYRFEMRLMRDSIKSQVLPEFISRKTRMPTFISRRGKAG